MRTTLIHLCLIIVAVGAVYGRSIQGGFVLWDDDNLIVNNPHIAEGKMEGMIWHWEHSHHKLYIPVVYTMWWCLSASSGMNPTAFHAANLLVFAADACLVYAILTILVRRKWAALGGALIFALHPLQVESVAWATGMKDLLCTFFSLTAIALYLRRGFYWAATLCFVTAMLCKPSAVMVPFMIAVIDLLIINRRWRQTASRIAPWLIGAVGIAIVAACVQPPDVIISYPLWSRLPVAVDALDWYLRKLFWPGAMGIDYGWTPLRVITWHIVGVPWLAVAWIIPAGIAAVLIYLRKPVLTASAVIFALALLPVSGLQPFEFQMYSTVADRYANLAILGPALAAAWLLAKWNTRGSVWITFAIVSILGTDSFLQTGYWRNDQTLFEHDIAVNPNSVAGHNNLALVYHRLGRESDSHAQHEAALQAVLQYPDGNNIVARQDMKTGEDSMAKGDTIDARRSLDRALDRFGNTLKQDPSNSEARVGYEEAQRDLQQLAH